MLFTLAHELGHLLIHHDEQNHLQSLTSKANERDEKAKTYKKEFYAHAFASCLLMPAQGVGLALKKIRVDTIYVSA